MTCRTAEYADVITDGAPTLHRAPVVQIIPIPADDVIGYLSQVDWPDGTGWEPVYVWFSADGRIIAATEPDGIVRIWNTTTGRPIGEPLTGPRSASP